MIGSTHTRPEIPKGAQVEMLRRADEKANRLTPESLVTVINRGREVLTCKFDGEDYEIPPFTHNGGTEDAPFLVQMPYGAALLFQHHTPIPGTRDAYSANFAAASYLGILDTDKPEACQPLTREACERAGQAVEAIERSDEEREAMRTVNVKDTQATRVGQGGLGNAPRRPESSVSTVGGTSLDKGQVMRPAGDGVSDEIRGEEAEGIAEGVLEEVGAGTGGGGRRGGSRRGR